MNNNITGIVAISDFEPVEYIPYKESIISAFNLAEEIIVIYGGSIRKDSKTPVLDELIKLTHNYNIKIEHFNWPKEFKWTQFSKTYNYGRSLIKSKWGFFFTCDEIFPDNLKFINKSANILPIIIDYISLARIFLISKNLGVLYTRKRIIFRNKINICFGKVSSDQPNSNFRDFGRVININGRYSNGKITKRNLSEKYITESWKNGRLLKGFRDNRIYKTLRLPLYYINTHTLFMPVEMIKISRQRSFGGYEKLTGNYKIDFSEVNPYKNFVEKIRKQSLKRKINIKWPNIIEKSIEDKFFIDMNLQRDLLI